MITYSGTEKPPRSFSTVKAAAKGRWKDEILPHFGVDQCFLSGKHCPCPICGGKDRFRLDDKDGHGTYICGQCGAGDGFTLIAQRNLIPPAEVLKRVGVFLTGDLQLPLAKRRALESTATPPQDTAAQHARAIMAKSRKRTHPYLEGKMLSNFVDVNLKDYVISSNKQTIKAGALLVPFHDLVTGELVTLQYINADKSRWFIGGSKLTNAVHAVRGSGSLDYVGVVEGYADALTVSMVTGADVIMAGNASAIATKAMGIQALYPTKRLVIFSDNDEAGMRESKKARELTGGLIVPPP